MPAEFRVVLITANGNRSNSYNEQWLRGFRERPDILLNHIDLLSPGAHQRLVSGCMRTDGVVLLHSVTADVLDPLSKAAPVLESRTGPMLALVGNEINLPWAPMSEKIELLDRMSTNYIGTQLLLEAGAYLYRKVPGAQVVSLPHAAPREIFSTKRSQALTRPFRIGTRSADYLPFLGDEDRPALFEAVSALGSKRGWDVDISSVRMDEGRWLGFLRGLDATVATEAGSFYTDDDDQTVRALAQEIRRRDQRTVVSVRYPGRVLLGRLPWRMRQWMRKRLPRRWMTDELSLYAEERYRGLFRDFFERLVAPPFYMKAISSRHLEAAATSTPQLLMAGRYNDILLPEVHYVSVQRDMKDLSESLDRLSDARFVAALTARAREVVWDGHRIDHRVEQILGLIRQAAS